MNKTDKFYIFVQPLIFEARPQKCFMKPYPKAITCIKGSVWLRTMEISVDESLIAVGGGASD